MKIFEYFDLTYPKITKINNQIIWIDKIPYDEKHYTYKYPKSVFERKSNIQNMWFNEYLSKIQ